MQMYKTKTAIREEIKHIFIVSYVTKIQMHLDFLYVNKCRVITFPMIAFYQTKLRSGVVPLSLMMTWQL